MSIETQVSTEAPQDIAATQAIGETALQATAETSPLVMVQTQYGPVPEGSAAHRMALEAQGDRDAR